MRYNPYTGSVTSAGTCDSSFSSACVCTYRARSRRLTSDVTTAHPKVAFTSRFDSASSSAMSSSSWASLATPLTITFAVESDESVLLLASISRVQHSDANTNVAFQIIIDGTTQVAISNTGDANGMQYDAIAVHGVATGLSTGAHYAELQYKVNVGTCCAYIPQHDTDGAGYLSLTAERVPSTQLVTSSSFPTAHVSGSSTSSWRNVRSITFTVETAGESVVILADISRVQHIDANSNVFLRILVDSTTEVAIKNSGGADGWNYKALSFHGVTTGLRRRYAHGPTPV